MLLLEYDADTAIVNGNGQTPRDVTHDKEIREMLEGICFVHVFRWVVGGDLGSFAQAVQHSLFSIKSGRSL